MDRNRSLALVSAFLAISAFVLALKLLQPASITVEIGPRGNATVLSSISGVYSFDDVLTVFFSALVAGASATFILLPRGVEERAPLSLGETILNDRKAKWQDISKSLKSDEMTVYQTILDSGGIVNQGDLVEKAGLSKATVSRTLDLLESKGLVEKRRRGMGNVVLLK
jgi:DNA-binding transcriptional ArsR family regulator